MPEYRRVKTKGGTYFFTVVTNMRQPILTTEGVRQALRQGIQRARQTLPFQIDAWVLLPDHLHAVWTLPSEDDNYAARWAIIKRQVSTLCGKQCNEIKELGESKRKRQESGIWQRRYWEHQIRDDLDFQRHMDYLHWNPVKHGYVRQVADWPFSSFHRLVFWCVGRTLHVLRSEKNNQNYRNHRGIVIR
ncbi:MAG: transposase [Proteobacteria bacterium]|nr:transposase [Pseudomonadota bacterium]MBU4447752.1 transposase [Pseudomonadota bacterium]MCG2771650.1 transposase [Desulfobacterales bacterium]